MSDWETAKPLNLKTARFVLESHNLSHVTDTFLSWWNDAEVQQGLTMPVRNWDKRKLIDYLTNFNYVDNFSVGIFCRETNLHIGFITIKLSESRVVQTNTVIGDKRFWGKGVVLEVRKVVLKFIFEKLNAAKVVGKVDARNFASVYNYKAQQFRVEGVRRQQLLAPDGSRRDQVLFGLLREEWCEQQGT